jgi:DNA-binding response OmpR family regulator
MRPSNVLLVSSDPEARQLYSAWFAQVANLRTTCTSAFDHAQEVIEAAVPDVVLLDVTHFQQWNDCACLGRDRRMPPVVVLTGWVAADGRFRRRAFDAGCAAFVAKPCHPRVLVSVLGRVLAGERHIVVA